MAETIILSGFPKPQKDYYKVYVCSITFNQASYIVDCLNGVAIQQTDFPFVHHVIDDCSTDGEQEVIKTYLNNNCDMENAEYYDNDICSITIAKNKSNPNCTLAVYFLKRNLYRDQDKKKELYALWRDACPYEALCEGDDYWISPIKLQKQVNHMNTHNDCSMCFHNAFILKDKGDIFRAQLFNSSGCSFNLKFEDALCQWYVPTASILFRTSAYKGKPSWQKQIYSEDLALVLNLSLKGTIYGFNDVMSVYRIVKDGKSASQQALLSFVASQKAILFESFLKAPNLNKKQKEALLINIKANRLFSVYKKNMEGKQYYKLVKPLYLMIALKRQISRIKSILRCGKSYTVLELCSWRSW